MKAIAFGLMSSLIKFGAIRGGILCMKGCELLEQSRDALEQKTE